MAEILLPVDIYAAVAISVSSIYNRAGLAGPSIAEPHKKPRFRVVAEKLFKSFLS